MDLEDECYALKKNPKISITNPKIFLKLLRNFGHLIRNLAVNFTKLNDNLCTGIEQYLEQYCFDSLQRLSLRCNLLRIPFKNVQKPLKTITSLHVCTVRDQKGDHIQFFNENNLPNVQYITIYNGDCLHDSENIHYENIEYFTFLSPSPVDKFPFSFGNLKHLILAGNIIMNDELCEGISNIEHLTTLKIMSWLRINSNSFCKLLELKNIQSNVVEMQFQFDRNMFADDILHFLKKSKKIRKFTVHLHEIELGDVTYHYSILLKTIPLELGNEWEYLTIDPYRIPFDTFFKYKCFVIEKKID